MELVLAIPHFFKHMIYCVLCCRQVYEHGKSLVVDTLTNIWKRHGLARCRFCIFQVSSIAHGRNFLFAFCPIEHSFGSVVVIELVLPCPLEIQDIYQHCQDRSVYLCVKMLNEVMRSFAYILINNLLGIWCGKVYRLRTSIEGSLNLLNRLLVDCQILFVPQGCLLLNGRNHRNGITIAVSQYKVIMRQRLYVCEVKEEVSLFKGHHFANRHVKNLLPYVWYCPVGK